MTELSPRRRTLYRIIFKAETPAGRLFDVLLIASILVVRVQVSSALAAFAVAKLLASVGVNQFLYSVGFSTGTATLDEGRSFSSERRNGPGVASIPSCSALSGVPISERLAVDMDDLKAFEIYVFAASEIVLVVGWIVVDVVEVSVDTAYTAEVVVRPACSKSIAPENCLSTNQLKLVHRGDPTDPAAPGAVRAVAAPSPARRICLHLEDDAPAVALSDHASLSFR